MIHLAIGLFVICLTLAALVVASFFFAGIQRVDAWDLLPAAIGVVLSGATVVVVRKRGL